jgi:hypothetical protein
MSRMTDEELKACIANARRVLCGPQHGDWEVIADAEAILADQPALLSRAQVEEYLCVYS